MTLWKPMATTLLLPSHSWPTWHTASWPWRQHRYRRSITGIALFSCWLSLSAWPIRWVVFIVDPSSSCWWDCTHIYLTPSNVLTSSFMISHLYNITHSSAALLGLSDLVLSLAAHSASQREQSASMQWREPSLFLLLSRLVMGFFSDPNPIFNFI